MTNRLRSFDIFDTAIFRKVFCVGTVGEMDMGYNEGMSNWTRTCCLIYNDGTKQLINFIQNNINDEVIPNQT